MGRIGYHKRETKRKELKAETNLPEEDLVRMKYILNIYIYIGERERIAVDFRCSIIKILIFIRELWAG